MSEYFDTTITNIEEYLLNNAHNTSARNLSSSSSEGFLCEVVTKNKRFFEKIRVDEKIECVIMEIYPGINVPAPYRAMTSMYCMEKNSEKKIGNLVLDPEQGDIHCHVEASFKDGPLSGETVDEMERIAIMFLMSCTKELEEISHGMLPTKDSGESELSELFEGLGRAHKKMKECSGKKPMMPHGDFFHDLFHLSDDDPSDDDDHDFLPDIILPDTSDTSDE